MRPGIPVRDRVNCSIRYPHGEVQPTKSAVAGDQTVMRSGYREGADGGGHGGGSGHSCMLVCANLLALAFLKTMVKNHHPEKISTPPKFFAQQFFPPVYPVGLYTR